MYKNKIVILSIGWSKEQQQISKDSIKIAETKEPKKEAISPAQFIATFGNDDELAKFQKVECFLS